MTASDCSRPVPDIRWPQVFDIERCAGGGQFKIIALIEETVVIVRILAHPASAARRIPPHRCGRIRPNTQPYWQENPRFRFRDRIDGHSRPVFS